MHQTQGMLVGAGVSGSQPPRAAVTVASNITGHVTYGGIGQSIRHILKNEGWRSLWNGNGANCLRVIPNYGLRFSLNDK